MRRIQLLLVLTVFLFLQVCSQAYALPSNLRVKLFEAHGRIESVKIRGPLEIVSPGNHRLGNEWISVVASSGGIELTKYDGSRTMRRPFLNCRKLVVRPLDRRGVRIKIGRNNIERAYLGQLSFSTEDVVSDGTSFPALAIVNDIPTIEYVASVVGSEAPPRCPAEALKALAVLTISIVEHKDERQFVGDSTKEQAYKGCEHATENVFTAVKSVYQKRLLYQKSPIQVFFHSTCAGGTSSGADIFGENARSMTYLQPVKCVYCTESPFWKVKTTDLPVSTFRKIFDGSIPVVTRYDAAKRPVEVSCGSDEEKKTVTGYDAWLKIGRTYGWGKVPGTRYKLETVRIANAEYVRLRSSGAGHGVGLCQWGAVGLAKRGKKCDEILKFYFPGCDVVTMH